MKFLVAEKTLSPFIPPAIPFPSVNFSMDTLPSSVSTFQIPIHHQPPSSSSSRDFHHYFRAPTTTQTQLSSKLPQPSSISNRPTNFPSHNLHFNSSSPHQLLSPSLKQYPTLVQHRAAAGYAAALVDVCRRNNTIEAAERDARRFGRLMRNEQIRAIMADPLMGDSEKGEVVKEIVEKGEVSEACGGSVEDDDSEGAIGNGR